MSDVDSSFYNIPESFFKQQISSKLKAVEGDTGDDIIFEDYNRFDTTLEYTFMYIPDLQSPVKKSGKPYIHTVKYLGSRIEDNQKVYYLFTTEKPETLGIEVDRLVIDNQNNRCNDVIMTNSEKTIFAIQDNPYLDLFIYEKKKFPALVTTTTKIRNNFRTNYEKSSQPFALIMLQIAAIIMEKDDSTEKLLNAVIDLRQYAPLEDFQTPFELWFGISLFDLLRSKGFTETHLEKLQPETQIGDNYFYYGDTYWFYDDKTMHRGLNKKGYVYIKYTTSSGLGTLFFYDPPGSSDWYTKRTEFEAELTEVLKHQDEWGNPKNKYVELTRRTQHISTIRLKKSFHLIYCVSQSLVSKGLVFKMSDGVPVRDPVKLYRDSGVDRLEELRSDSIINTSLEFKFIQLKRFLEHFGADLEPRFSSILGWLVMCCEECESVYGSSKYLKTYFNDVTGESLTELIKALFPPQKNETKYFYQYLRDFIDLKDEGAPVPLSMRMALEGGLFAAKERFLRFYTGIAASIRGDDKEKQSWIALEKEQAIKDLNLLVSADQDAGDASLQEGQALSEFIRDSQKIWITLNGESGIFKKINNRWAEIVRKNINKSDLMRDLVSHILARTGTLTIQLKNKTEAGISKNNNTLMNDLCMILFSIDEKGSTALEKVYTVPEEKSKKNFYLGVDKLDKIVDIYNDAKQKSPRSNEDLLLFIRDLAGFKVDRKVIQNLLVKFIYDSGEFDQILECPGGVADKRRNYLKNRIYYSSNQDERYRMRCLPPMLELRKQEGGFLKTQYIHANLKDTISDIAVKNKTGALYKRMFEEVLNLLSSYKKDESLLSRLFWLFVTSEFPDYSIADLKEKYLSDDDIVQKIGDQITLLLDSAQGDGEKTDNLRLLKHLKPEIEKIVVRELKFEKNNTYRFIIAPPDDVSGSIVVAASETFMLPNYTEKYARAWVCTLPGRNTSTGHHIREHFSVIYTPEIITKIFTLLEIPVEVEVRGNIMKAAPGVGGLLKTFLITELKGMPPINYLLTQDGAFKGKFPYDKTRDLTISSLIRFTDDIQWIRVPIQEALLQCQLGSLDHKGIWEHRSVIEKKIKSSNFASIFYNFAKAYELKGDEREIQAGKARLESALKLASYDTRLMILQCYILKRKMKPWNYVKLIKDNHKSLFTLKTGRWKSLKIWFSRRAGAQKKALKLVEEEAYLTNLSFEDIYRLGKAKFIYWDDGDISFAETFAALDWGEDFLSFLYYEDTRRGTFFLRPSYYEWFKSLGNEFHDILNTLDEHCARYLLEQGTQVLENGNARPDRIIAAIKNIKAALKIRTRIRIKNQHYLQSSFILTKVNSLIMSNHNLAILTAFTKTVMNKKDADLQADDIGKMLESYNTLLTNTSAFQSALRVAADTEKQGYVMVFKTFLGVVNAIVGVATIGVSLSVLAVVSLSTMTIKHVFPGFVEKLYVRKHQSTDLYFRIFEFVTDFVKTILGNIKNYYITKYIVEKMDVEYDYKEFNDDPGDDINNVYITGEVYDYPDPEVHNYIRKGISNLYSLTSSILEEVVMKIYEPKNKTENEKNKERFEEIVVKLIRHLEAKGADWEKDKDIIKEAVSREYSAQLAEQAQE